MTEEADKKGWFRSVLDDIKAGIAYKLLGLAMDLHPDLVEEFGITGKALEEESR